MKDLRLESFKRLQHIEQAITFIEDHTINETSENFEKNLVLNNAILFQFTIIGEAIMHVENEILQKYDYPWYKVRSFRNLISHEYFNVKLIAVWQVIQNDLPELKELVKKMLRNEF